MGSEMATIRVFSFLAALATVSVFGFMSDAIAGCRINYSLQNSSATETVWFGQFQVKSKGGVWKKVAKPKSQVRKKYRHHWPKRVKGVLLSLDPGEAFSGYSNTTFGCQAKRQYRFVAGGNEGKCQKSIYYPSATSWTTSTDINFGDISRHCR